MCVSSAIKQARKTIRRPRDDPIDLSIHKETIRLLYLPTDQQASERSDRLFSRRAMIEEQSSNSPYLQRNSITSKRRLEIQSRLFIIKDEVCSMVCSLSISRGEEKKTPAPIIIIIKSLHALFVRISQKTSQVLSIRLSHHRHHQHQHHHHHHHLHHDLFTKKELPNTAEALSSIYLQHSQNTR
jgi:hypothetical protein